MKILLLEDERMLRTSIVEYLSPMGYLVEEADEGEGALKQACTHAYDLLVLDINVPGIDGFELVRRLQEGQVHTPIIFISAMVDIEDITRGFELGCTDYIKKPFHLKELLLRIEKLSETRSEQIQQHMILSKNYSFDRQSNTLYYQGKPQKMHRRWLQIIQVMTSQPGLVVDFDKFRQAVWDNEMIDNATIRAEINRLKKALHEDFISNSRGLGYFIEKPR